MQHSFLGEVADILYRRYCGDVSSLTLVFPSRRARLFFSEALSQLIDRPIWQPRYMSMDDIMCEASSFVVGDKVVMLSELYKIYVEYHPAETFDKFYFWGEMLLSDFDLIDKYMIDADMLFRNICDLKELEADLSYLTPEMREVIHEFWSHFEVEASLTEEKLKFLSIWKSLAPVYHRLRERLEQLKIAYTGMVYRSAVDCVESGVGAPDLSRQYVFVGFNALSECEKRVLKFLNNNSRCEFFWDYDSYYTDHSEQEAGRFLRENLSKYKALDEVSHDNMLNISKNLTAVSCVSNVAQCKYVNSILREISPQLEFDKQTAIVLTDESLLLPLLHSLPEEIANNVNVTMGYPLRQTTAYSFVERLIELQKNCRAAGSAMSFYHVDVVGILSHPYIIDIAGLQSAELQQVIVDGRYIRVDESLFGKYKDISVLFSSTENYLSLSKYLLRVLDYVSQSLPEAENRSLELAYISLIADEVVKLNNSLKQCDIEISVSIYISLLRRHLQTVRIPFSGEPLRGLQVMGILETRNLDFRNVIILSMNDDNFPGNLVGSSSFIPYNLRMAYGMPTPEHHESVYAYYFYRLIQRAERVDMLYCSRADDKSTGEQSRYIYQLDYESPYRVNRLKVGVDVFAAEKDDVVIEKRCKVLESLNRFIDNRSEKVYLSPTALARYVACPMRFYFASVARIKVKDELVEGVDNPMFGTILHAAMESLYTSIVGVANPAQQLELMLRKGLVEKAVVEAINVNYLKRNDCRDDDYTGSLQLVKRIIMGYIVRGIIPYDIRHNHFAVMNNEESVLYAFTLDDGRVVNVGGKADRIDSLDNGMIRVVDYKTGSVHRELNGVVSLFEGEGRQLMGNLLQTMIYSMVLYHKYNRNVQPTLYFVRAMGNEKYSPSLIDKGNGSAEVDYAAYADEFEQMLGRAVSEIFDQSVPFRRCDESESSKICEYCNYKLICKRQRYEGKSY